MMHYQKFLRKIIFANINIYPDQHLFNVPKTSIKS